MNNFNRTILASITCAAILLPVSSQAAIKTKQLTDERIVVTYHASDLAEKDARQVLEREIRIAAKLVCGIQGNHGRPQLALVSKTRSCYRTALRGAMEDLMQNAGNELTITAR